MPKAVPSRIARKSCGEVGTIQNGSIATGAVSMSPQAGGFRPAGDQSLVSMQPARFASEADFQGLLARFPELFV